ITLDELPDLKSYPMAEEEEIIKGDVNLDGNVDSADIVLLAKYLTAKTELNAKQYEAAMLTDDSRLDVFDMVELKRMVMNQ
ncbi:MAG: dockerin type I repeat-containing protein, partial [Oscillospiraceae bacterium]|nr:dockerin type I repeat-containing protein [Oscillospiraceae bacterium]